MQNFFTGHVVPMAFRDLSYNHDVIVDITQMPFHAPPEPVSGKTRTIANCARAPAADASTTPELEFLESVGLLLHDSTGVSYIHPRAAAALYTSGLFAPDLRTTMSKKSPTERNALVKEAMKLFSEYTIPARINWMESIGRISPTIQLQTQRSREIQDMKQTLLKFPPLM